MFQQMAVECLAPAVMDVKDPSCRGKEHMRFISFLITKYLYKMNFHMVYMNHMWTRVAIYGWGQLG